MKSISAKTNVMAAVVLFATASAQAHLISGVSRGGSSSNPDPVAVAGGLVDGAVTYNDRTHVYANVAVEAAGADYIMVSNSDKTVADYSLDVTVDHDVTMGLFIDWRVGDSDNANGPALGNGVMDWVGAMGFVDSGLTAEIDEGNDGSIDQTFSIYVLDVAAGTTLTLGAQDDGGGRNMYTVAAIPEPATLGLLVVGLGGLLRRRR